MPHPMATHSRGTKETVSVVVPVFNEGSSIARVLEDLMTIVESVPGSEIVAVDDGSRDGTGEILSSLAERDARVRVIASANNRGHGPSLMTGIQEAAGRWLFLVDADGQIKAEEFETPWARRGAADLVMGARIGRSDCWYRRSVSRVVQALASRLAGDELPDPNVPFKLLRRELWDDLAPYIPEGAATPSLLIAVGAALRGWRVDSVPVTNQPRWTRRSKLRLGRLARLSFRATAELISFRRRLKRAPPRGDGRQRPELPAKSAR